MQYVYCLITFGESDSSPEMSKQAFATIMRSSIDMTILSHDEEPAWQGLTDFGKQHGELWVEQQRAVQNLAEAEKILEAAAKRVQDLREELTRSNVASSISQAAKPRPLDRKRKLDEVEGIIQDAAEVCKKVKREETTT
jgi:uncharacterized protein with von Willebrand factor type A (vWA) domain